MATDLAEAGLERLICEALTGDPCEPASGGTVGEPSPGYGGGGWSPGNRHDYDREYCVDLCLGEDREELDPKTLGGSQMAQEEVEAVGSGAAAGSALGALLSVDRARSAVWGFSDPSINHLHVRFRKEQ